MDELLGVIFGLIILYWVVKGIIYLVKSIALWIYYTIMAIWPYIVGGIFIVMLLAELGFYFEAFKKLQLFKNHKIREKTLLYFMFAPIKEIIKISYNKLGFIFFIFFIPAIIAVIILHLLISIVFYMPIRIINHYIYSIAKSLDDEYKRKHFVVCRECNHYHPLPKYKCSNCGIIHDDLSPSLEFGIFNHICECGAKLPVYKANREKLESICPTCNTVLLKDNSIISEKEVVTIIDCNTDKTKFAYSYIETQIQKDNKSTFLTEDDEKIYEGLKNHRMPQKNKNGVLSTINVYINKHLFYFYILDKYLIKESDNLILEPYLSFSDNILFVVSNDIQFSFDVLSRLAEVLEKQLHLEHLKKIDILITVFVKTDQSNVKEELLNNGGSAFVQLLETKFENVVFKQCNECE